MTNLRAQRRMAADVLDVGANRVWFDPDAQAEIADAITRDDIRELIAEGTITAKDAKTNSRGRARARAAKRAYGHRRGPGTRKGRKGGRQNSKRAWVAQIRAQRRRLKELRAAEVIDRTQYRAVYNKASGGEFDDVARLEAYIQTTYNVEIS
jgi:large subunit ribosomal protein L19e